MTERELTTISLKWGYEEELGEIWLERKHILREINKLRNPTRIERRLRSMLRTLRAKVKRKDRPTCERTAGMADFSPDKIRRKW